MNENNDKSNNNTTTYCVYWLTTTPTNPSIIRPRIVFFWRTTTTRNPAIIRQHIVFTEWRQRTTNPKIIRPILCLLTDDNEDKPNHNTTTYCAYWRTTTTRNPTIIRPHIVFTDWRQQRKTQSYYDHVFSLMTYDNNNKHSHNTTTYCVYWRSTTTTNPNTIVSHIVFTQWRQLQQTQP